MWVVVVTFKDEGSNLPHPTIRVPLGPRVDWVGGVETSNIGRNVTPFNVL